MPKRRTHEEFVQLIAAINNNIEIIGRYINSQTKIKCRCKKCKGIWYANPTDILHNESGCPHCRMSKGEEIIKNVSGITTAQKNYLLEITKQESFKRNK